MTTALSLPTLPSGVTGASYIPDLTDTADIQQALKLLYYGSTASANSANGIYGALTGLKNYVDASISGVNVHEVVKAATIVGTPIPGTYAAGTTDIGAKITYTSTGVVTIDGVTLALNDRILVKDGTTALSGINSIANGIYYVSTLGATGVACVLTRAEDSNNSIAGEMGEGDFVYVANGTTPNANTSWILTSSSSTGTGPAGAIKIGTDPITYIQFGSVTWGLQTANTIFAAPDGSAGTPTFRNLQVGDISTVAAPSTYGQAITYAPVGNGLTWTGPYLPTSSGSFSAGTSSVYPVKFTAGATLTTPVYGAIEATTDTVYLTTNPGSTTTGTGRGYISAPQMVFSLASSPTSTNTTQPVFATANDVLSVLEPAKLYRFRAKYYSSFTYTATAGAIQISFAFSNAPTAFKYSFKTYPQTNSSAVSLTQAGAVSVTTVTTVVPSQVASGTWVTEIDGYFTTHATATSTFTPNFINTAASSSTASITSGSWIEVEKLGSSAATFIAGNWA
jgi:hypothetical protein